MDRLGTSREQFMNDVLYLSDPVERGQDQPILREIPHQIPVAGSCKAIFQDKSQLGPDAPGILKPDLVNGALLVGIAEPGRSGLLIILDVCTVLPGQGHSLLAGNRGGFCLTPDIRERPIIPVIRDSEPNFAGRNLGKRIFYHLPHVGQRRDSHGRTIGIPPLIWIFLPIT